MNLLAFKKKKSAYQKPLSELQSTLNALDKSQAVIEFNMDGTIITANENFLSNIGYSLDEIKGQHHSLFVDPAEKNSPHYRDFWARLNKGEFQAAQYKRFGKDGREIWIEATYNPIFDDADKPYKVVKFATNITDDKIQNADYEGQLAAVNKAQAVIEFNMDGTIIKANENFLKTVGYELSEIGGRHHRMFVEPTEASSAAYREFWDMLNRGQYQAAQYKRFGKDGKEIWIEASYNPIFDYNGKPFKVVKYATNISDQVALIQQLETMIGQIDTAVNIVGRQSSDASSGSNQTTANVQAVASGAEELHASVQEIAQSMAKSKVEADDAFHKVINAVEETQKLTAAALAMNGVVELIQNIANQVNLLSLNATIEAARAGEAGKGFAVVAHEVKNLAGQASDATSKISDEIQNIQEVAQSFVSSLTTIRNSIDNVRSYVTSVAGAVEEQSAVAQDMSSNMQTASRAVGDISANVAEILAANQSVSSAVETAKHVAAALIKK